MDWIKELFLEESVLQAIVIISMVSAIGLLLNRLSLKGITLGVTFVFFVGIIVGNLGIRVNNDILEYAETFGLILFIYSLGLQVGPGFFNAFFSSGYKLNIWALSVVFLGTLLTLMFHLVFGLSLPNMVGLLCGSVTNTPALGAAQQTLKQLSLDVSEPALAAAVAYPLGVAGVIFSIIFLRILFKNKVQTAKADKTKDKTYFYEFSVKNPEIAGKSIKEIAQQALPHRFIITRLWSNDKLQIPNSDTILNIGDKILLVSTKEEVDHLTTIFGKQINIDWNKKNINWSEIDSQLMSTKIVISKASINGKTLGSLKLRNRFGVNVTRIIRGGIELLPHSDLILRFGDKLIIVGLKSDIKRSKELFGDKGVQVREPNLVAIFIGLLAGVILGSIPFTIPGISVPIKLGIAGGPIIVGILLGAFGPHIKLITYITTSANLMLQRLGLTMFLACLGISAGEGFLDTLINGNGVLWIGLGAILTIVPILIVAIIMLKFTKFDFETIAGLLCGSMSNPMALNYVDTQTKGNQPQVAYASVYPLSMFTRILLVQLLILIFL